MGVLCIYLNQFILQSQVLLYEEEVFAQFYSEGQQLLESQDPMCSHFFSDFQVFKKHTEDVDKLVDLIIKWSKLGYWKSVYE
jgi:hypothetical protein